MNEATQKLLQDQLHTMLSNRESLKRDVDRAKDKLAQAEENYASICRSIVEVEADLKKYAK